MPPHLNVPTLHLHDLVFGITGGILSLYVHTGYLPTAHSVKHIIEHFYYAKSELCAHTSAVPDGLFHVASVAVKSEMAQEVKALTTPDWQH